MPIVAVLWGAIAMYTARATATVSAKIGFTTFQSGIALAMLVMNGLVVSAYVAIVYELYTLIQNALNWFFNLSNSASPIVSTAISVVKAVGVWDGIIDALNLIMPVVLMMISIKLLQFLLKLLRRFNEMSDRIIKTILSHGI